MGGEFYSNIPFSLLGLGLMMGRRVLLFCPVALCKPSGLIGFAGRTQFVERKSVGWDEPGRVRGPPGYPTGQLAAAAHVPVTMSMPA